MKNSEQPATGYGIPATEQPKIDLAEIEAINASLKLKHLESVQSGEVQHLSSWAYGVGVLITGNEAKQIAEALEALPKLVEALKITLKNYNEICYKQGNGHYEKLMDSYNTEQALSLLSLFTNKTQTI